MAWNPINIQTVHVDCDTVNTRAQQYANALLNYQNAQSSLASAAAALETAKANLNAAVMVAAADVESYRVTD